MDAYFNKPYGLQDGNVQFILLVVLNCSFGKFDKTF